MTTTQPPRVTLLHVPIEAGKLVRVKLQGACHNCPSSTQTMQGGIKVALQEVMPEVTDVVAV